MRSILLLCAVAACSGRRPEQHLLLVTIDGTRWQEVFRGPDEELLRTAVGAAPGAPLRHPLWRDERGERRQALLPFLWGTVAARGQIFGDVDAGGRLTVTNQHRNSYPGYHEMLSGFPSPFILGNVRLPNPDVTVLEWLNGRPAYAGRVAAFASWELFRLILNVERSGLPVDVGVGPGAPPVLERLRRDVAPPWGGAVYDAFTFEAARTYLERRRPLVLYVGFNDTDEWAHIGRYDRYLESIARADKWLRQLWEIVEATPEYRGHTSLLVTCDHGRGEGDSWRQHSSSVAGAEQGWAAVMGPGVPARGERQDAALTLGQVAATAGALLGEDYRAAVPAAAPPLPIR
jgi:hypothetical protein